MKTLRIASIALVLPFAAAVIHPLRVPAQGDHLICYTMNDPLKFPKAAPTTADLLAVQPDFAQRGCQIIKPFEFCVPASKQNVQNPPAPLLNVPGQPLGDDDFVCYLIKCPNPVPVPNYQVEDQFGLRLEQKFQARTLCVPARKFVPPCDPAAYPRCGGTCADGTPCQKDTSTKMCTCGGTQSCEGSKPDASGYCAQDNCPPNTQCKSEPSASGPPLCHCVPLPPPECPGSVPMSLPDGTLSCDTRSCPNHQPCVVVTTSTGPACQCQPPESGCNGTTAAECAMGTCTTNPNFICTLVGTQCQCGPPPQDCVQNPLAGGACPQVANCPPGTTCKFVPSTSGPGGCACQ